MRAGLASTSGAELRRLGAEPRLGALCAGAADGRRPWRAMEYSTGTSHVLSAILTKATGISTWQFAQTIAGASRSASRWRAGRRIRRASTSAATRCCSRRGRWWRSASCICSAGRVNGRQVVPAAWVDTSCVPRTASAFDAERRYGYGWWIQEFDGGTACFAWGYGGQYIIVFRDLDLVVVATSSTAVSEERRGHRRQLS